MTNLQKFKKDIIDIIITMNDDEILGFLDQGEKDRTKKAKDIKKLQEHYSNQKCKNCPMNNKTDENDDDLCKGNCDKYCIWLKEEHKIRQ